MAKVKWSIKLAMSGRDRGGETFQWDIYPPNNKEGRQAFDALMEGFTKSRQADPMYKNLNPQIVALKFSDGQRHAVDLADVQTLEWSPEYIGCEESGVSR